MDTSGGSTERTWVTMERARVKETLQASEARYRTLFEIPSRGFWWTSQHGYVTEISAGIARMLGYSLEELVGRVWTDFVDEEWLATRSAEWKAHESGRTNSYRIKLKRQDGTPIWATVSGYPLRYAYGKYTDPLAASENITKERQVQEEPIRSREDILALIAELKKADEHKNEVLRMVAHQLRDPLSVVLGRVELLERKSIGEDEATRTAIETLKRKTEHLARLVADLLDSIQATHGKMIFRTLLKKEIVTLNTTLNDAIADIKPDFEKKGVALSESLSAQSMAVNGDPIRITECIENILRNALEYTPEGGLVSVSLQTEGGNAVIKVQDNGSGLRPEFLARIFEPYQQDPSSLHRGGSLGLGLAIVKRTVEMHGGDVSASSPGLGKGSLFTMRLPILQ